MIEDITKEKLGSLLSTKLYGLQQDVDIKEFIERLNVDLLNLLPHTSITENFYHTPTKISESGMGQVLHRFQNPGLPGFRTGFPTLDENIGGIERNNIYTVNARSGAGKTTLLTTMAWNLAGEAPVLIFSPEARIETLSSRLICFLAGVFYRAMRRGDITETQLSNLEKASQAIKKRKLYIYDMPSINSKEMNRIIEKHQQETGEKIGTIILDYLQQMEGDDSFTSITTNMKELEELVIMKNVGCIMASQMGRAADDGSQVAGKGSGKIEELSSVILGFYHPTPQKDEPPVDRHYRILKCTKNRHEGVTFKLGMWFDEFTGRLKEEGIISD